MSKLRLFTSESVTEGHPDKVCDQISDTILDAILAQDPGARVAVETMATTGLVHVAGEVTCDAYVDIPGLIREKVLEIGYNSSEIGFDGKSCGVSVSIGEQSRDIAQGVDSGFEVREQTSSEADDAQGAGDQGLMFGYATNETPTLMPAAISLAHKLSQRLATVRKSGELDFLRPDGKTQVTIGYEGSIAKTIQTVVLSTQHNPDISTDDLREAVRRVVIQPVLDESNLDSSEVIALINPTGRFEAGGPMADAGLTGRKIIVDTYGGRGAHGGGAFSGKDPSKVDRSAAYAARHMAKNAVAAGLSDQILVQVAYAIGVAEPMGVYVNTYGSAKVGLSDGEIAAKLEGLFDLRPGKLIDNLKLLNPIYGPTASYGHFGREPETVTRKIQFGASPNDVIEREVELFTWEKLDRVEDIKAAFSL
jgi:S-adenosylmethionine synthetase